MPKLPKWLTEFYQCQGCGKDCEDEPADAEAHTSYGLCADCMVECLTGERCWKCCESPCQCLDDYTTNTEVKPTVDRIMDEKEVPGGL